MTTPELPITELPDGSGCFTATILSEEEAMALPRAKRPLCYRIPGDLYHAIFEAVGTASMCWNPRPGNQVFDSTEAEKVAVNLCFKAADEMDKLHDELDRRHEEYSKALNRRVDVENTLAAVAAGKREPLTREECKALAQKLGNA